MWVTERIWCLRKTTCKKSWAASKDSRSSSGSSPTDSASPSGSDVSLVIFCSIDFFPLSLQFLLEWWMNEQWYLFRWWVATPTGTDWKKHTHNNLCFRMKRIASICFSNSSWFSSQVQGDGATRADYQEGNGPAWRTERVSRSQARDRFQWPHQKTCRSGIGIFSFAL